VPVAAEAAARTDDWRTSPVDRSREQTPDLSRFRGAARRDNVLVIVLESAGAEYLQLYHAASDPMPNVTTLSARSIVFDNAYAVYPESIKSLFTMLCGRYAAFDVPVEAHAAAPCTSIASVFGGAGYRTALFHSGRFGYLGMDSLVAHKGFDILEDAGAIGGNVHSSFGIDERSTVRRALDWIDTLGSDQPFFATYLPVAGHHPYLTNEQGPFPADTEINRYLNALHESDAAVGDLLSGLRRRHLDSRTLVMVVGDHGEAFGQHAGNAGHTLFIYDENVHVPLMIAVPGLDAGVRSATVASAVDLPPTLLDLAGLARPSAYEGASLLDPGSRMALFFTDYSLGFLGLRDGCWKNIFAVDSGRSSLFDVCRDPGETADLSAGQVARVRAYQSRLETWSTAVRKSLREARTDSQRGSPAIPAIARDTSRRSIDRAATARPGASSYVHSGAASFR
jgi:lipoteichoic acid synthase